METEYKQDEVNIQDTAQDYLLLYSNESFHESLNRLTCAFTCDSKGFHNILLLKIIV